MSIKSVRQSPGSSSMSPQSPVEQNVTPISNLVLDKSSMVNKRQFVPSQTPRDGCAAFWETVTVICSYILIIVTFPLSMTGCLKVVAEYQRAIVLRFGRLRSMTPKGPGMVFIVPCVDEFYVLDLRTVTFDIPRQTVLTLDAVTVGVDAIVYFKIMDPILAVMEVTNFESATKLLASAILRNALGTQSLTQILKEREEIANMMQTALDQATDPWGILVERIEIKDVHLPESMQRAMAVEAEATKEARAKIVAADGEKQASKALKQAAEILQTSPAAVQLRYLQTLNSIAAEKNSTIIFPLPMELLSGLKK